MPTPDLDQTFHALSDPTRRSILAQLMSGSARVTDVASDFEMSLPAVSKHIRVLESAGLIDRQIEGRVHRLSLNAEPLTEAYDWVGHYVRFWSASLEGLRGFLDRFEETPQTETSIQLDENPNDRFND